jgi:CRP/FNR family transcriptional regulator, cyclic AMP receptor protein
MANDHPQPPADTDLRRFERVSKGAVVADELTSLIGKAPLFTELDERDVAELALYMGVYKAAAGETIIREGGLGDCMLLIVRGEVEILKQGAQREPQRMTSVGPAMTIGEMSMIDGEPRFATCRTTQPTTFAVLTRASMAKLVSEQPQLATKILVKLVSLLSSRLRQTSAKLLSYMDGVL